MLVIKALTKMYEDWGEDVDDFYITYHVDIGPEEINGASDLFSFELISPKRLDRMLNEEEITIGRGYLIARDFNIKRLETTINRIIGKCEDNDIEKSYNNLSKYFRWEMDV
jgi:hypothetical protein